MRLLVTGSQGAIGRRLRRAFPDSIGLDRSPGAGIRADLADVDYDRGAVHEALLGADAVIHLATSPDPHAPDELHFAAVQHAARLVAACERHDVARLLLASSGWADLPPQAGPTNAYGHSKRVFEALAQMYAQTGRHGVALRFGWVPHDARDLDGAPQWMLDSVWDDERLVREVRAALGGP